MVASSAPADRWAELSSKHERRRSCFPFRRFLHGDTTQNLRRQTEVLCGVPEWNRTTIRSLEGCCTIRCATGTYVILDRPERIAPRRPGQRFTQHVTRITHHPTPIVVFHETHDGHLSIVDW